MDFYFSDVSTSSSDEEICLAINRPKKKAGRKIFKETRHPIYRGVRKRNGNKWVCELREPNKKSRIWLGTYPTPEMAARAHDVAALAFRGKSACLNFADSAWKLPVPESGDSLEIRRVAGKAAEMFRPEEFGGCYGSGIEELRPCSLELQFSSMFRSRKENGLGEESRGVIIDEEEIFEMPRLIDEMAQGLLLSPPFCFDGELSCSQYDFDVSLWTC